MFGDERYRVRVCIGPCILPTTIRSTQCVNYSQSRRGEARRDEERIERGSNNSDPLFPRPLWISKRNFGDQRVAIGASHGSMMASTEFIQRISLFHLWDASVLYVGELRKTGWQFLSGLWKGSSVNKFERVIFPWKNCIIPFPRIG